MEPKFEFAPITGRNSLPVLLSAWGLTGTAVEVGTHRGAYAEILLHNWPGTLHCIDPWQGTDGQVGRLAALGGGINRTDDMMCCRRRLVDFTNRFQLVRKTSAEAIKSYRYNSLDFVYVDGDHRPEAVKFDIENWWLKVKPGGILAGHDYLSPNEADGLPGKWIQPVVDQFGRDNKLTVWIVRELGDSPWSYYFVKPV